MSSKHRKKKDQANTFMGLLFLAALMLPVVVILQLFMGGVSPLLLNCTIGVWIAFFVLMKIEQVRYRKIRAEKAKKQDEWQATRVEKSKEIIVYSKDLVQQHMQVLRRKLLTGCVTDDYGIVFREKWDGELEYFENVVLLPELMSRWEKHHIDYAFKETSAKDFVDQIVSEAKSDSRVVHSLPEDINAVEFEGICASVLIEKGWNAVLTPRTGDQGADVKATKEDISVVLQCKLYSSPVGNKAVQEVLAAKVYYEADIAAVVTNSSYTASAIALAKVSQVRLYTYEEFASAELDQPVTETVLDGN